jgi:hypothetical protein
VPTAITVTATQGGTTANGLALRVMVLTGAAVLQNGGTASATNASSTSITTTQTGSRVYGAMIGPNAVSTPNGITTQIDDIADAVNGMRYATFKATSLTGTPGATTIGDTNAGCQGVALFEVLTDSALGEDLSAPAVASTTSATLVTTASFTPPGDSLLVALVSSDGGSGVTTMDVQGGGLIWTQMAASNVTARDYVGVWIARVATPDPDDPVITATQGGSTGPGMAMRIYVLTGAKPRAQQTGATTNTVFAASTSFTQSITTTQTGSRVYGASSHFPNSAGTAVALTTLVDDVVDATNNGRYATFKATSLTGTPGATTLGFTVASSAGPFAQAEILTAGTLTEDGSAPAVASTTTQTFVSCLNFVPPPGSLLVVLVASDGGAAVTTMTVSGGGLTFTELVKNNTSGNDYAGVWVADIPAAAGGVAQARPGRSWQRRFHHREWLPQPPAVSAGATNAPAEVALSTGTVDNPSVTIAPVTTTGTGTGTANNTTSKVATGPSSAAGTGTANNPSPALLVNAGLASGTGVANNPTVTTGGAATNAPAGLASGTGTADNPTIKIAPVPGSASGTGVANDTTSKVSPTPTTATATGTAFNPTVLTGAVANAGHAAGTGTANNTTSKIAPVLTTATASGVANNPTITVGTFVAAGLASGTGTANNATIAIGRTALAGLASGTGVANSATLAIRASVEAAAALGVANNPTIPTALLYGRSSVGTGRVTAGVASAGATSAGKADTSLTSVGAAGTGTAPRGTPGSGTTTTGKPGGD